MTRHFSVLTAIAVFLGMFLMPNPILAGDYITDTVSALQGSRSRVYIAPGTQGANSYTENMLQSGLKSGDAIVLIMLPASAEEELGVSVETMAARLSERIGVSYIIGLAVGRKVVGYAPSLPAGVAVDQMRRAQSVSNDAVTALATFAQNVHLWQSEHSKVTPTPKPTVTPKPTATPAPPAEPLMDSASLRIIGGIGGFMFLLGPFVIMMVRRIRRRKQTPLF